MGYNLSDGTQPIERVSLMGDNLSDGTQPFGDALLEGLLPLVRVASLSEGLLPLARVVSLILHYNLVWPKCVGSVGLCDVRYFGPNPN